MITKAYEIECDECGAAEPDYGNRKDLEARWREDGWVFVNHKHFCSEDCRNKHCKPNSTLYVKNEERG